MSDFPGRANVVVIGAGIVGNCLVGHLARLGWTDLVLIDKGPLPNPGGSTGHASNFIFPVRITLSLCYYSCCLYITEDTHTHTLLTRI